MKRLFHYTGFGKLKEILAHGKIIQATEYAEPPEIPAVWFSYRQDWEPTATPDWIDATTGTLRDLTFEEFANLETPARIEINPQAAPLDWQAWQKTSRVNPILVRALAVVARRQGADPADWRMSFEPVKMDYWRAIELFVNRQWWSMKPY